VRPRTEGIPHSVQTRLIAHAKALGVEANLVLTRYGTERFLYRLSRSPHADRFVLKGALLMLVWLGETIRPTRDADLLGFGDLSEASLTKVFQDVCTLAVEPDGVEFDAASVRVAPIRNEDSYGGLRATLDGRLGAARLHVQVDVGIGDIVTPEPDWLEYPSLLDLPRPRLRAYHPETSIAEKLHAMVVLGSKNSRMRDFFDIHALAMHEPFSGDRLTKAVAATFERRRTAVPGGLPLALTMEFAASPEKQAQWLAFRRKANLATAPEMLTTVIGDVAAFLSPVIEAARLGKPFAMSWPAGGPWTNEYVANERETRHA
jgi:predicted nucleotidyltransferase component of viral defense system